MSNTRIEERKYVSKYIDVDHAKMHYIEAGQGDVILFLHGVPTSSFVWRNIIPHLSSIGHCIAPDLMGFGFSDKPEIQYTIDEHVHYINQFIQTLGLKKVILVMHGWGSVIGFHYAMNHEKNCRGLIFYEAFLQPADEEFSLPLAEQLSLLNTSENKATMSGVSLVDKMISQAAMQQLNTDVLNAYRQPFKEEGTAQPILQYLNELSEKNKAKINKLIANYSKKLTHSNLPKLMLYSVPGFITSIASVMWAKENLSHLEMIDIGEELHLAQESYPALMGETMSVWLQGLERL